MKFRVSPKDLIIFIVFCVFLLVLSSLAVVNLTSLLNNQGWGGLNVFKGFTSEYIVATLFVFFAVLIAVFLSVSSTIFEREKGSKGFGLKIGEKDEKGYSRWAKPSEIRNDDNVKKVVIKDQNSDAAGIPLINDGKNIWVDNGSYHNLVIGATGSGKTTSLVDPMVQTLARKGESIILTDPKGELYRNHSEMLRSKGYNIVVLNFRDPNMGNAWNPLTLPYRLYQEGNVDKSVELLEDVASNILYDPENKNDPFWEKSAADFFSGLALGLFQDAKEEEVNISSINYMSTVGEENFASSNYTKEYFTLKGENSTPYVFAKNTITSPSDTKGSILSVFSQKIRGFSSREQLSEMLSYSDFNMRDIGTQKTAVFMIIHDEKTTYHALATIFLKQTYETLIDVAQNSPKGKLPYRTNFILDEFANMPPLKDVTTMVTAARSRQIRFTFIIQNFAQLNDVYGKEQAETIRSNCGNIIYLITTELAALEEISKLCGEVKSKDKDKTASTPLITVSDLQKLKMFEVVILRSRLNPFKTYLTPSFNIDWGNKFGDAQLVKREIKPLQFFDIKEFVKNKKRNKLFESLDNSGGTPFKPAGVSNESSPFNNPFMDPGSSNNSSLNGFDFGNDILSERNANVLNNAPIDNGLSSNVDAIDIDNLVKRIDAKIAELEKEEQEQGNSVVSEDLPSLDSKNDYNDDYDKLDATFVEKFDDFMKDDKNGDVDASLPIVSIDNDSVVVDDVTDEEYYDDFFDQN